MGAPPKEGATFTPDAIAQMARAIEIALETITREGGMPDGEQRRRLAALVCGEASTGVVEAERLARIALHGLRVSSTAMWSA